MSPALRRDRPAAGGRSRRLVPVGAVAAGHARTRRRAVRDRPRWQAHRRCAFREQFLPGLDYSAPQAAVEAPAVFVGHGVSAPELHYDDFAGLDLHGRIAVLFSGAPMRFDRIAARMHRGDQQKAARAGRTRRDRRGVRQHRRRRGAACRGRATPTTGSGPACACAMPTAAASTRFPPLRVIATVSASAAELRLRRQRPHRRASCSATRRPARARLRLAGHAGAGRAHADRTAAKPQRGRRNCRAAIAALAREHVVYSAHLDHLGVGARRMAPATGRSTTARSTTRWAWRSCSKPRAALHAEAGAEAFAAVRRHHRRGAGAARCAMVRDASAGRRWSPTSTSTCRCCWRRRATWSRSAPSIRRCRRVLQQAARDVGVELSPDPFPEEDAFVRSDQYAFVRAGIPALYLDGGVSRAPPSADPKLAQRDVPAQLLPPALRRRPPADPVRRRGAAGAPERAPGVAAGQRRERAAMACRRFFRRAQSARSPTAIGGLGRKLEAHEQPASRTARGASNTSRPTRVTCRSTPPPWSSSPGTTTPPPTTTSGARCTSASASCWSAAPATSSWPRRTRWA